MAWIPVWCGGPRGPGARSRTATPARFGFGQVSARGPAAQAGIAVGDIITSFAGSKITSSHDLLGALRQHEPGQAVDVTIRTRPGHDDDLCHPRRLTVLAPDMCPRGRCRSRLGLRSLTRGFSGCSTAGCRAGSRLRGHVWLVFGHRGVEYRELNIGKGTCRVFAHSDRHHSSGGGPPAGFSITAGGEFSRVWPLA